MTTHNEMPKSDYALLVLNPRGQLRILFCPFRVQCIRNVGTIKRGTIVWVNGVIDSKKQHGLIHYHIHGKLYWYNDFVIQIRF